MKHAPEPERLDRPEAADSLRRQILDTQPLVEEAWLLDKAVNGYDEK